MVGARAPRILVVDDEASHLVILRKILEEAGYRVNTCLSAHEALERLRENGFDLILCDVWMPAITGLGLYMLVEEDYPKYERRFMFISADSLSEMVWEFIQDHNLPHIMKPFSPPDLLEKVGQVLREPQIIAPSGGQEKPRQRRDRRLGVRSSVRIQQAGTEAEPDIAPLVDISRRGVCFSTDRPYRLGAEVRVAFPFPSFSTLEQHGRVVWIEELQGGRRRVGIAIHHGESSMAEQKRTQADRRGGDRRRSTGTYMRPEKRTTEDRRSGLERREASSVATR